MPRFRARLWKIIKWSAGAGAVAVVLLLAPVAYVEVACRGDAQAQTHEPAIEPAFQEHFVAAMALAGCAG